MPPQPTPAQVTFSLVALGLIATILTTWFWAIGRLVSGKSLLPRTPVRVVPWCARHVLGIVLLYMAIINVVPPLVFAAMDIKPAKGTKLEPATLMMMMIAVNGTFIAIGPLLLAWWAKAGPADFGIERGKVGRDVLRGIVAWPLLAPIVFGVQYLSIKVWPPRKHPLLELVAGDPTSLNWGLTILSAVVLAPLAEEFLFRGVLLGWLGRWAAGLDRAKPATAVDPDLGPAEIWFEPEPSLCARSRVATFGGQSGRVGAVCGHACTGLAYAAAAILPVARSGNPLSEDGRYGRPCHASCDLQWDLDPDALPDAPGQPRCLQARRPGADPAASGRDVAGCRLRATCFGIAGSKLEFAPDFGGHDRRTRVDFWWSLGP